RRLLDALGRGRLRRNAEFHWITQPLSGQSPDLLWHRGGKQQRLTRPRYAGNNSFEIVDESHVEHLVGFVENERLHAAKIDEPLIHQVEQPTRRSHQNVTAALKCIYLWLLADTAENHSLTQAGMATVGLKAFCDLRS